VRRHRRCRRLRRPLFRMPSGEQVDRYSRAAAARTQPDRDYDGDAGVPYWTKRTASPKASPIKRSRNRRVVPRAEGLSGPDDRIPAAARPPDANVGSRGGSGCAIASPTCAPLWALPGLRAHRSRSLSGRGLPARRESFLESMSGTTILDRRIAAQLIGSFTPHTRRAARTPETHCVRLHGSVVPDELSSRWAET
jgi:hypothetical protein